MAHQSSAHRTFRMFLFLCALGAGLLLWWKSIHKRPQVEQYVASDSSFDWSKNVTWFRGPTVNVSDGTFTLSSVGLTPGWWNRSGLYAHIVALDMYTSDGQRIFHATRMDSPHNGSVFSGREPTFADYRKFSLFQTQSLSQAPSTPGAARSFKLDFEAAVKGEFPEPPVRLEMVASIEFMDKKALDFPDSEMRKHVYGRTRVSFVSRLKE